MKMQGRLRGSGKSNVPLSPSETRRESGFGSPNENQERNKLISHHFTLRKGHCCVSEMDGKSEGGRSSFPEIPFNLHNRSLSSICKRMGQHAGRLRQQVLALSTRSTDSWPFWRDNSLQGSLGSPGEFVWKHTLAFFSPDSLVPF